MTNSLIDFHVDGNIVMLTLNDPPANTYSYEMMQQLDACILKARMDEAVQVIVITGTGGTQRLARLVGKSKAIELMALGQLFDFEKGEALGLVNQIIGASDGADFMKQVTEYARQFTTPNKASRAVGRIKRAVQTGAEIPFESALALERELQQLLFQSEDAKEGLDAYVNKRKAEFKGK